MFLVIIFTLLYSVFMNANLPFAASQANPAAPTVQEIRDVRNVASTFIKRMERSRDVSKLRDLFVDDLARRSVTTKRSDIGSSIVLSDHVHTQARPEDWERFYHAQFNLKYFMVLYLAGTLTVSQIRAMEKGEFQGVDLFPPEVQSVLNTSPVPTHAPDSNKAFVDRTVQTIDEFHSLIATLERATGLMRQRFRNNAPERSRLYQDNLSTHVKHEVKPHVEVAQEQRFGFPPKTRFFTVVTDPQLFELTCVKTEAGMKIIWARVYPFN